VKPWLDTGDVQVFHGDCIEVMRSLPDASVDAVVTDPPYELAFMGKRWDATGIAYDLDVWRQALRVLKPGGHLLAFGGTRTWHRLAVAIEDAGFEVRDSIAWMYASGFPKSLDVSKAIDKNNGEVGRLLRFTQWFRTTGLRPATVNRVLQDADLISRNGTIAGHYFAKSNAGQPAIPTPELWQVIKPLCGDVPAWVDDLVARIAAEREVVGKGSSTLIAEGGRYAITNGETSESWKPKSYDITAPATPAAQKWQGWGTALKPAFEPIVVARKPLIGTVAENVLAHGTGALNIDGCRIGTDDTRAPASKTALGIMNDDAWQAREVMAGSSSGRWPANVILDKSQAAELDKQSGVLTRGKVALGTKRGHQSNASVAYADMAAGSELTGYGDTGGASRFFYVAKANSNERPRAGDIAHPTVKPVTLLSYLVRLVTPPGGTVLEPFAGSGTTLEACVIEGFHAIGIEREADYLPLIEQRLSKPIQQVLA
jgi:DNA modification methylase